MSQDWFLLTRQASTEVVHLSLPEHLDSEDFDQASDALLTLIDARPSGRWVLDLSKSAYMGSSALGLMVNVRQRVKQAGGRLALCGMSPKLLQSFRTCCLERLFTIRGTRDDAVQSLGV